MHPLYTDKAMQKQIASAYKANPLPSVQLQGFFEPTEYHALLKELTKIKYKTEYIPDRYSRQVHVFSKAASKQFASVFALVKQITGKSLKGVVRVERYGHRDFTLRNDDEKPPGLLVYFDCTPQWHVRFGGATIVTNEHGELARVLPLSNTLVAIDCSKAYPFVQYVNHYAKKQSMVRLVFS